MLSGLKDRVAKSSAAAERRAVRVVAPDVLVPIDWKETLGCLQSVNLRLSSEKLSRNPDPRFWEIPAIPSTSWGRVLEAFYREADVEFEIHQRVSPLSNKVLDVPQASRKSCSKVRFLRSEEPDQDLLGQSGVALCRAGVQGPTLAERLLLGFGVFVTTGRHLDVVYQTLCSGSQLPDGRMPGVYFDSGEANSICVDWHDPKKVDPRLGGRQVTII